jgi:hypothetical protein
MTPHTASISDVRFATNFERVLEEKGLHGALGLLNATTPYRLTGVYRFQDGLVRSVVLFDRKNPELVVGVDVPWKDSYCRLVAENGRRCEITDSLSDVRLGSHAAREAVQAYVAVLLKTPEGAALGTLCHYDLQPVEPPVDVFDALERVSPVVERALWRLLNLPHMPEPERAVQHVVRAAPTRLLQFHKGRRRRS